MKLGLIAGNRYYPIFFAQKAQAEGGVSLVAVAFKGETKRLLSCFVKEIHWIEVGELQKMIDIFKNSGVNEAVMIGQITPSRLFKKIKADSRMQRVLDGLSELNAESIFTAVAKELEKEGIVLKDARLFLESLLAQKGIMTIGRLTQKQSSDVEYGWKIVKDISDKNIGQTVVVKNGTVVAVEAIEGTDAAILRGGKIARGDIVIVKVSKPSQDMRFDVPIIGPKTVKVLHKAGGGVLALEAGKVLILDKEKTIALANKYKVKIIGI